MSQEDIKIENGINTGNEAAFKLFDCDSNTVDSDSALLACMTTCYTQLVMRGWTRESLEEQIDFFHQVALDLVEEMEAE